MSKEKRINVAKALSTQLRATEESIDTALSEAAHLIEAFVTSRRAIRMSTVVGGDVHQNTLKAMLALNSAQQHMTAAHEGLKDVQERAGIGGVMIGEPDDKGDPKHPPSGDGITPELLLAR